MADVRKVMPYLAWMVLMAAGLPYWVRTVCAGILLLPAIKDDFGRLKPDWLGAVMGVVVFAVWIAPEELGLVSVAAKPPVDHPYIRLFGSAVVIATAEELFFRDWLYKWLAQSWSKPAAALLMLALFAVEHDKYCCAIIAGAVYFALYLRRGLGSAVVAHATTNFLLGLYAILTDSWYFW